MKTCVSKLAIKVKIFDKNGFELCRDCNIVKGMFSGKGQVLLDDRREAEPTMYMPADLLIHT